MTKTFDLLDCVAEVFPLADRAGVEGYLEVVTNDADRTVQLCFEGVKLEPIHVPIEYTRESFDIFRKSVVERIKVINRDLAKTPPRR